MRRVYGSQADLEFKRLAEEKRKYHRRRLLELLTKLTEHRPELADLCQKYIEMRDASDELGRKIRPLVEELVPRRKSWAEMTSDVRRKVEKSREATRRWRIRKKEGEVVAGEQAATPPEQQPAPWKPYKPPVQRTAMEILNSESPVGIPEGNDSPKGDSAEEPKSS